MNLYNNKPWKNLVLWLLQAAWVSSKRQGTTHSGKKLEVWHSPKKWFFAEYVSSYRGWLLPAWKVVHCGQSLLIRTIKSRTLRPLLFKTRSFTLPRGSVKLQISAALLGRYSNWHLVILSYTRQLRQATKNYTTTTTPYMPCEKQCFQHFI